MAFTGFPAEAVTFYDGLERENNKTYWTTHKQTFEGAVRAPLMALADTLADEFGTATVFRPYRDVRFSADKSPYKTHLGAFVEVAPSAGYYVQVSSAGVLVAGGFHDSAPGLLEGVRRAIADDDTGPALARMVATLTDEGWTLGGEKLKTAPRGIAKDHPRIDLLRHKQLTAERDYGRDPIIHSPELAGAVREHWRALRPMVEWLAVASPGVRPERRR
jgi:uncharacterized protein (TIGR02453 family)